MVKMGAGTRNYMAPELFLSDGKACVRTDIYSFGAIVSEMGVAVRDRRLSRLANECMADDPHQRPASFSEIELPSSPVKPHFFNGITFGSPKMTELLMVLIAIFSLWIAIVMIIRSPFF